MRKAAIKPTMSARMTMKRMGLTGSRGRREGEFDDAIGA
jgi:hypothetical protein